MFGPFGKKDETKLEKPIDRVLESMAEYGPEAPEYQSLLSSLERLYTIKDGKKSERGVSNEALIAVAGNLLGILIIVAYEQKNVMSSRGLDFVKKPK